MAMIRLLTTRSRDLQALAASGQTAADSWRALRTLLLQELTPLHAGLLAEPVANVARGEVDWYSDGEGVAARLEALEVGARGVAQGVLDRLVGDIQALAARLGASRADGERFLAEMLGLAMRLPGPGFVFVVGEQPVLAGWGHVQAGGRSAGVTLSGMAAPVVAAMSILPPPVSPYGVAPAARTWLWGVLGASLLAPLLVLLFAWRDPFGWFSPEVPVCRLEPGQLGLAQGLEEQVAREGVLRAELARLTADAGQRRLMCPPVRLAAVPPPPPPPRPPQPPSADVDRAQRQGAQRGKLQVILAWDDRNDLDLSIGCPSGGVINFIRRQACGGVLDVDANGDVDRLTASPVENVFFNDPAPGTYRVIVDPYGMRERQGSAFRVTIRREGQADEVVTGVAQNGRHRVVVTTFTVERP